MTKKTVSGNVGHGASKVVMAVFEGFLGQGAAVRGDDKVTLTIQTQGDSIDITMTKEEAALMADKLAAASK